MMKRNVSPIMTWGIWSVLVLAVFLLVTWEYFVAGFARDTSRITWLIMAFFIYGFVASFRVALLLQSEFKSLQRMRSDQGTDNAKASDLSSMFDSTLESIRRGERIEVRNLISAYAATLKGKVDNIGVIASMLITIGLLGTVVGLIITVTGLEQVLQSNSEDFTAMKAGLTQTVSGMGTAFYTTFFGALLGGVVLKVLGAEMKKSAQTLVAEALRFSEFFLRPKIQKNASEALTKLEAHVRDLGGQLQALGGSFCATVDVLDSKQAALADGLGRLVSVVTETSEQANQRADTLMATVDKAVEETHRLADERLEVLARSIESATQDSQQKADARLSALVFDIEHSAAVARRDAEARLDAKASDLARRLTEAASVLADSKELSGD